MLFVKVFFIALLLIVIGGFAYFAVTDIPIQQTETVETLKASDF